MKVERGANVIVIGEKRRNKNKQGTNSPLAIPSASSTSHNGSQQQVIREGDMPELVPTSRATTHVECYQMLLSEERRMKARQFALSLRRDYSNGAPRPACLPILFRMNVLQAMTRNAAALGFNVKGLCRDDFISPFNQPGPPSPLLSEILSSCPPNLLPTATQKAVIHHPWIDLIPIPRFRDNILVATLAGLDDDLLCEDILRFDGSWGEDDAALIVWGEDPWDTRCWEASMPFLKKWGWLIKDCSELCLATNQWREKRGEKRLIF